jgi:hypothetical protein
MRSLLPRTSFELNAAVFGLAVVLASVATGGLVTNNSFVRYAFAGCIAALVVGFGIRAPRPALYGTIVWLAALGLLRRLLSHATAGAGSIDPLLLTEPIALAMLCFAAAEHTAFRIRTKLGDSITILAALIVLSAFNPLGGSLFAGLSSLIFFAPLSAFWIGRTLSDATFRRALGVYAVCAIPAALYGLYQITSGFPSWDQAWIERSGYAALQVAGTVRPFSTFSSAAEYGTFLAAAIVIWLVLRQRSFRVVALAALVLLAVSVFYQSSRASIVTIAAAIALMTGARRGFPLLGATIVGAVMLALLPLAIREVAPTSYGTGANAALAQHEIQGLANPFDSSQSTAGVHISLIVSGIKAAFRNPIGYGVSSITIAGSKFGGISGNSEADISNAAIAMGLPGLAVFLAVFVLAIRRSYGLATATRDPLAIAALGILVVTVMQWLNGGQYAVAVLPWLVLGWVDSASRRLATPTSGGATLAFPELVQTAAAPEIPAARPPRRARSRVLPGLVLPTAEPVAAAAVPEPPTRTPRAWKIAELDRVIADAASADPARAEALRYFLYEIRPYASAVGLLPISFDDVVREQFGDLLARWYA